MWKWHLGAVPCGSSRGDSKNEGRVFTETSQHNGCDLGLRRQAPLCPHLTSLVLHVFI